MKELTPINEKHTELERELRVIEKILRSEKLKTRCLVLGDYMLKADEYSIDSLDMLVPDSKAVIKALLRKRKVDIERLMEQLRLKMIDILEGEKNV